MRLILSISLTLIILASCQQDNESDNNTVSGNNLFRTVLANTSWMDSGGGVWSFAPDKIFLVSDPNSPNCNYFKEGSYENIDYDGCTYDLVTNVVTNEDQNSLTATQMTSSGSWTNGGGTCSGDEVTIHFEKLNSNSIRVTINGDTYTLVKINQSYDGSACTNGTSNSGWLW
jgi:hypothetical protein